jgi:hypothetical protein
MSPFTRAHPDVKVTGSRALAAKARAPENAWPMAPARHVQANVGADQRRWVLFNGSTTPRASRTVDARRRRRLARHSRAR